MFESYMCEEKEIIQLQLLHYECNGYMQLINWLVENNSNEAKIEEFKQEYMQCEVERQALYKAMIKKYVPEKYRSDNYIATFDYNNCKVNISEKSSCCK